MTGKVNEDYEATIEIDVSYEGRRASLTAIVDTGFSEFLMLPTQTLLDLGAQAEDETRVTLGDGSIALLDVYVVKIEWFGLSRSVRTLASDGDALIGMKLLEGHDLSVQVVPGGEVGIVPM